MLSNCLSPASYFGELSSSEEEEEDKDINIMDSGEDEVSRLGESTMQAGESQDVMAAEGVDDTGEAWYAGKEK